MSGLDTRNLLGSFATGFQLMEGHYQRKENDKRYDVEQTRVAKMDARQDKQYEQQETDRRRQEALPVIKSFYEQEAAGMEPEMSAELEQAFEQHPYLRLGQVYDPDTEVSVGIAQQVAAGEMDPNAPEALGAFNQFFKSEIDQGSADGIEDGQTVRKKIARVMPGTDGESLAFELEVEVLDAEGKMVRSYMAPMTTGHGSEDEEVMQVPMEKLINAAVGMEGLQKVIPEEVKEKRRQYLRNMGVLGSSAEQYESVRGPGGSLLQRNINTGEMKSIVGRESNYGNGGYAPGSLQRDMEFLQAKFPDANNQELYDLAIKNKDDGGMSPADARVMGGINSRIKQLQDQLETTPDAQDRERIQGEIAEKMAVADEIMARSMSSPEQPQQAREQDPAIQGNSMRLGLPDAAQRAVNRGLNTAKQPPAQAQEKPAQKPTAEKKPEPVQSGSKYESLWQ
jgi:hypothetical protein